MFEGHGEVGGAWRCAASDHEDAVDREILDPGRTVAVVDDSDFEVVVELFEFAREGADGGDFYFRHVGDDVGGDEVEQAREGGGAAEEGGHGNDEAFDDAPLRLRLLEGKVDVAKLSGIGVGAEQAKLGDGGPGEETSGQVPELVKDGSGGDDETPEMRVRIKNFPEARFDQVGEDDHGS